MNKVKIFVRIILIACLVGAIVFGYTKFKNTPNLTVNDEIKLAFDDFEKFTHDNRTIVSDSLCSGGFINTGNPDLEKITDSIVSKRIINQDPLEYASTQDEAGITCLANIDKWVLFSALNDGEFYCADSSGKKGPMSFDRETFECTR